MLTRVYSPLGIPTSYREMDGSGVHAFKFTDKDCNWQYVKFTWKSRQGNKGLTPAQASDVQGKDFNHLTNDLYSNIAAGNYPIWDLYIQLLKPEDFDKFDFNPLDTTKIWPTDVIPERKVGELTLNQVPDNFFQHTEQVALAPSNLIPGIEPSEDRMLQGRLFSYADTQRYRLGINHNMFPVNAPRGVKVHSHSQDGAGLSAPRSSQVNYQPSRSGEGFVDNAEYKFCEYKLEGTTQQRAQSKPNNFKQAGDFYRSLDKTSQQALIDALKGDLGAVKDAEVRTIFAARFYKADADYGTRVAEAVKVKLDDVKKLAATLED